MSTPISSYDGGVTANPQQVLYPTTVEQIQTVLRDSATYPSPVRAMGSYHSLTPCASSDGTMLDMKRMNRIIEISKSKGTFTAEAGLQFIDASRALRAVKLQFMTNIEIGNLTLGSAACCHTKDALDGMEFGQVGSYVTKIKWVTPTGDLAEASEDTNPELLQKVRASYGLCGVIYEVTFKIKPLENAHFSYFPRPVSELTEAEVEEFMKAPGLVCWTVGDTAVFQKRETAKVKEAGLGKLLAAIRRRLWNHGGAGLGRFLDLYAPEGDLRNFTHELWVRNTTNIYKVLAKGGGFNLPNPDKTIDYRSSPPANRYAFTFWAFPSGQWLKTLREYLAFAEEHFQRTGFRCNMPLGSYHIRKDQKSLLSYTYDGEVFSIDPIHAPTDQQAWSNFLREFNEFAYQRNGIPLLNQSPFVERKHCEKAYGDRWQQFSDWVREQDPDGRMLNPFFAELLAEKR